MKKRCFVLLAAALMSANLFADSERDDSVVSPIGVSILPFRFCEWPAPDGDVFLLRLGVASCHQSVSGLDVAAIVNYTDAELYGLGVAPVNSHGECYGLQAGLVNATGCGYGLQMGLWNMAEDFAGLQLGLLNYSQRMCGVQIGLGNVITESPFPVFIILNACF